MGSVHEGSCENIDFHCLVEGGRKSTGDSEQRNEIIPLHLRERKALNERT